MRLARGEHRLQEVGETVRFFDPDQVTPDLGKTDDSSECGKEREHPEWIQHEAVRILDMTENVSRHARFAAKGQVPESEHVERGQTRGQHADPVQPGVAGYVGHPGGDENLVLGEEPRKRWEARDRVDTCEEDPARHPQSAPEATHLPHVLLVVHREDDGAGAEEEQRLEEGVRSEVKDRRRITAAARGEEHVAELTHRRIGEHLLDVVLRERDRGCHQRGDRPRPRDHRRSFGCGRVEEAEAADHVDTRGHHRGCVDQRGDRSRARHRVGQPDVERNLGRLPAGSEEEAQPDHVHE
jgi:hypothetical protein